MNYYPHHIGDFNNSTRHLTRVERSLYRDLIEHYYDTEQPLDSSQFDRLSRRVMAFTTEEKEALEYVLNEFFYLDGGLYRHCRCDREIEKYRANNSAKARAGKASAEARRKKKEIKDQQLFNACSTEREQNPTNQEPITKNQEPIKHIRQPKVDDTPYQAIIDLYHEALPELPAVKALNAKRKQAIKARWNSEDKTKNLDYWKGYFQHVRRSNFLMGSTGWMANIDFLFTESKYIKIIEGGYEEGVRQ